MALSLALNWSPPPSSPLFDENMTQGGSGDGNDSASKQLGSSSSSPRQASGTASPSSPMSNMDRKMRKENSSNMSSSSTLYNGSIAGQDFPHNSNSISSQTKSYASAASHHNPSRSASVQQVEMPSFPRAAVQSRPEISNQNSFGTNGSFHSSGNNHTASPYRSMAVTEDGRRNRSTSGPQKSQVLYNDTLQQHPIGLSSSASTQSFRSGYGLPAGAMAPVTPSHPALQQANINPATSGYHPYRRMHKGSEVKSPSGPNQPALPPATLVSSSGGARSRSTSATSSNAAREANSKTSSLSLSYSNVSSNYDRQQQQVNFPQQQSGLRNSPQLRPAIPSSASQSGMGSRMEIARSDRNYSNAMKSPPSSISSPKPPHSRSNSGSSFNSASDGSQISATPASSSGRNTPTLNTKKPSPLSKAAIANARDDNGDHGAVYGGSDDDEDTIRGRNTPTPDEIRKKGLSSKLKKALSFSTLTDIQQAEAAAAVPDRTYGGRNNLSNRRFEGNSAETNGSSGSTRSTSPPPTPDNGVSPMPNNASSAASISSRRSMRPPLSNSVDNMGSKRSLFNRKFNSSTDNISISSTVSSASVMLRKVGNLGKLAKRSSLMGLTNMFNKDKEVGGKQGNQQDNFGSNIPPGRLIPANDASLGGIGKRDKSKLKKGSLASASVSHATVEVESNGGLSNDNLMTPAASYVRQHQLQMKQQAEADRLVHEKEEAERAATQRNNALSKAADDAITESRQKMIEKEKERLKSKRGWRKKLGMGSTSDARQSTGLETIPVENGTQEEITLNHQQSLGMTGVNVGQMSSSTAYVDKSADNSYDSEELAPPQMPGAMVEAGYESSGDEFETDSLRHWGEGIERSRESASKIKHVKGILKNSNPKMANKSNSGYSTPPPLSHSATSIDRPFAHRNRANSYDAPQATNHPGGSIPSMSQMSTTPAGSDRVDGVVRASTSEERSNQDDYKSAAASPSTSPTNSHLGHHANSSMPTLSLVMNPTAVQNRGITKQATRKQLVFADNHIYHSTWPAHIYDRRGELATCNCLTPLLAQRIKEELNTYKMEEMAVAPSSRIHTHFFV